MRSLVFKSLAIAFSVHLVALFAPALPAGKSIWEFDRHVWQVQNGLPEDTIQALAETPDGYLWVGSREGLARFDGVRFTIFDRSNTAAFRDDSVLALYAAKDGSLWIGTEGGGLLRYSRGAFERFGVQQGLTDGFVRAIYEDQRGRLLAGTDHGLFLRSAGRFVRIDGRGGLPAISVHAMAEDREGRLWIGGSGLYVLDHGTARRVMLSPSAASNQIKSILAARDGVIWVGTYAGLYRIKGHSILHTPFDRDVEANICQDRDGNVWLGWVGDGLTRFQQGKFVTYRAPAILPNNTVLSIFEDSDQDLWVGTENGLVRISDTGVSVLENKDGIALGNSSTIYENVSTIYDAPDGSLWIANGHLYRISGWRLLPFALPPEVSSVQVRTVFRNREGVLWLGTGGEGVVAIRHGAATRYTTRQGLVNDFIRAFCEDRDHHLWIGTDGGVSVWNGKRFRNLDAEKGLVYPSVRTIVEARDGEIWIGTDGGISVFRNGAAIKKPVLNRLVGHRIWAIHQDADGALWIGTRADGLFRLAAGALTHYTTKCGLPDDNVYQILQDRRGNLWFSGRTGIFQIGLDNLNTADCAARPLYATVYANSKSLEVGEVNGGVQPAGSSAPSGALWFPTIKGAIRIEPDEVRAIYPRRVLIEQVVADGRQVAINAQCRLPPGEGRLEIRFTSPALIEPQQIRFKYRLEGFEKRWSYSQGQRIAYYTNLPPGDYRFRVIAYGGRSTARQAEAGFPFTWRAHFYQTAWFLLVCALCLLSLAWAGFRLHMAQTKARYAAVLAERSRLAREMHDTVIQGCVGVSTLLEAASSLPPPDGTGRDLLDRARAQIRQTLAEAREAVWNLRHTSLESGTLASGLSQLARQLTAEGAVRVTTETTGTPVPVDDRTQSNLLLTAREAARNALEHANPQNVFICLSFARSRLCMEISDDGCGFDAAAALQLQNGHYGILGMKERVEQLGGRFLLTSKKGNGTQVTAVIPLRGRRPVRAPE
ncbi:MAG: sensor histidine kinase [Terriglobia bacterium]